MNHILRAAFCIQAFLALSASMTADGWGKENETTNDSLEAVPNRAFVSPPPRELRTTFPACDEFLKVEWLRPELGIGYAKYDARVLDRRDVRIVVPNIHVVALVVVGADHAIVYDITFYRVHGGLENLLDAVRHGEVALGFPMEISYKGEATHVYPMIQPPDVRYQDAEPLLTQNKRNTCLVYPNGKRAWLVEGRTVAIAYAGTELEAVYRKTVTSAGADLSMKAFGEHWILDINGDGVDDYVTTSSFVYSAGDRFFHARFTKPEVGTLRASFAPAGKTCIIEDQAKYITMLGNAFYVRGCNLTKLTSTIR